MECGLYGGTERYRGEVGGAVIAREDDPMNDDQRTPACRVHDVPCGSCRIVTRAIAVTLTVVILLAQSGCTPVPRWQRRYLSDPLMIPDYTTDEDKLHEHIHPRREGTQGGGMTGGGGCGC